MYCRMKAIDRVTPAAKPPPGRSCPRRKRCSANSTMKGKSQRITTRGISMVSDRVSPSLRSSRRSSLSS
ncbi:hypothetical protein D3C87_2069500 [compost metagenome]